MPVMNKFKIQNYDELVQNSCHDELLLWPGINCIVCLPTFGNPGTRGVFRGAIVPWPPLWPKKILFDILKKLENLVWPPLCVSTSGQQKFGPPRFEILNTPLPGTISVASLKKYLKTCLEPHYNPDYRVYSKL